MARPETVIRLTRRGHRAMRAGLESGASIEAVLFMEIMSRIKRGYQQNVIDICEELIDHFGSAESAVIALKSGNVRIETDEE